MAGGNEAGIVTSAAIAVTSDFGRSFKEIAARDMARTGSFLATSSRTQSPPVYPLAPITATGASAEVAGLELISEFASAAENTAFCSSRRLLDRSSKFASSSIIKFPPCLDREHLLIPAN